MARSFNDASNQYLEVDSAVLTDEPITMACQFKSDDATTFQTLMSIADKDVNTKWHKLILRGDMTGDPIHAGSWDGATSGFAITTWPYAAHVWHHACGVFAADNDRRVYIDGGSKGTNSNNVNVINLDTTAIGRLCRSSGGQCMSGVIAEAAIWNVALTDDEVKSLSKGFTPLLVRPQNLVAYWPLIRTPDIDKVGGYDLTAYNNPGVVAHWYDFRYPTLPIIQRGVAPKFFVRPLVSGSLASGRKGLV